MADTDNFTLFIPFAKVDSAKRQISGYASTPALDTDDERISLEAVKKALPGYMQWRNIREMHGNRAVGVAKDATVDDVGLFLTSRIVDDSAWKKCEEGVYKGYSIGGKKIAKVGDTITELELLEISIVDRPANPECRFSIDKAAKPDSGGFLVKSPRATADPSRRAVRKMAQAVELLTKTSDDPDYARDGFSRPAKTEKGESTACEAHGKVDCAVCAEKRDVSTAERKDLAGKGDALPGGGFPIKNKEDLANARQAVGRAKNPGAARALIRRRAAELGVKLPDKWKKKMAKRMIRAAEKAAKSATVTVKPLAGDSVEAGFLTLSSDTSQSRRLGKGGGASGHERIFEGEEPPFLELQEPGKRIAKRMSTAGGLSYCFDTIRQHQRDLMSEAKREGGDKKDLKLASRLGAVANELASIIGQKATHEGGEALDLTDADDQPYNFGEDKMATVSNDDLSKAILDVLKAGKMPSRADRFTMARSNLKKAKKASGDIAECMKAAHGLLKAVYLAKKANADLVKAGKKPMDDNDDDDNMEKALAQIVKAHSGVMTLKTFIKGANVNIKKAASGRVGSGGTAVTDSGPDYEVPAGVKGRSVRELARMGPGEGSESGDPPIQDIGTEWQRKGAKIGRMEGRGYISKSEAQALIRAAAAEAQVEVLSNLPAGGNRPYMPGARTGLVAGADGLIDGLPTDVFKGVNVKNLTSNDQRGHEDAVAKMLGNNIMNGHGKDIMDPEFSGAGGV